MGDRVTAMRVTATRMARSTVRPGDGAPSPADAVAMHDLVSCPRRLRKAVRRAIVIDFEGLGVRAGEYEAPMPALLGMLEGDRYTAFVLAPGLHRFVGGRRRRRRGIARDAVASDFEAAVGTVVERAERGGRLIAFFSGHELREIERGLGADHPLVARMRRRAFDAKDALDRLSGRGRIERPADRSLSGYAGCLVPECRPHPLSGRVADRLRRLAATPNAAGHAGRFAELLAYNREDCALVRACVVAAALRASRASTNPAAD